MAPTFLFTTAFIFATTVFAAYDKFFFSTEAREFKCDDTGFACNPPEVCAHDDLLDKHYCCLPDEGGICWARSPSCEGEGTQQPGSNQVGCASGPNAFCCWSDREQCTQKRNQINICWATPENTVAGLGRDFMNETYSSLLSAHPNPSPTSLGVNIGKLKASLASASLSSTQTPTPTATPSTTSPVADSLLTSPPTSTSPPTATPTQTASSGLSGGAIAGIAIGALAGLAILGTGSYVFWRRQRNTANTANGAELDGTPDHYAPPAYPPQEKWSHTASYQAYQPVEMEAPLQPASEMEGPLQPASEMEGSKPKP